MSRTAVGNPAFVQPRWSRWLGNLLSQHGLTANELGRDLARYKGADSSGGYPGLVRSWLAKEKTVGPDMAFLVGEILRPRLPWCSGIVTLYAAGYFEDFISVLGAVERRASQSEAAAFTVPFTLAQVPSHRAVIESASVIFELVHAVPLLGSVLVEVDADPERSQYAPERRETLRLESEKLAAKAHQTLSHYSEDFLADAFANRNSRNAIIDPGLEVAREVAANERKLLDSIVECYTVSLLDEWARQIWHEIHTGDLEFYNGGEDWLYARADSFKKDAFQVEKGAARA